VLAPAVAAVLPLLVGRGLARQAHRNQAARRELEAYLDWLVADAGLPLSSRRQPC